MSAIGVGEAVIMTRLSEHPCFALVPEDVEVTKDTLKYRCIDVDR